MDLGVIKDGSNMVFDRVYWFIAIQNIVATLILHAAG